MGDGHHRAITVDHETYEYDAVVLLYGDGVTRKKNKLPKRIYGSSHTISEDEVRNVYEKGCRRHRAVWPGLSTNAAGYFDAKG